MGISQTSSGHRKWVRGLHRKRIREKERAFIAEGFNALESAIEATQHPIREVLTEQDHLERVVALVSDRVPVYLCSRSVMEELSTEKTPQGVLIICSRGECTFGELDESPPETVLYLDRVSDPGNLGAIIRTSLWFGVSHLALSPFCVDPFNAKVIRASAGAIFKARIYQPVDSGELMNFSKRMEYLMVAMVPHGGIRPDVLGKKGRKIIMMGQEADGLSNDLIACADLSVSIPGRGDVESLNLSVASAIALYEIAQSRARLSGEAAER